MITSQVEKKLLEEKKRWEAVAVHMADQASTDSQCNYLFRKAQEKLAEVDRALGRVATGTFGRCDECGAPIEPDRLELLMDSDCHICATCATAAARWARTGC